MTEEEFTKRKNRIEIPYEERVEINNNIKMLTQRDAEIVNLNKDIKFLNKLDELKQYLIDKKVDSVITVTVKPKVMDKNLTDKRGINFLELGLQFLSVDYVNI